MPSPTAVDDQPHLEPAICWSHSEPDHIPIPFPEHEDFLAKLFNDCTFPAIYQDSHVKILLLM